MFGNVWCGRSRRFLALKVMQYIGNIFIFKIWQVLRSMEEFSVRSRLVALLLLLWHLNKRLNYKLHRETSQSVIPLLLPVGCKSEIVQTRCFPPKLLFWQKKKCCVVTLGLSYNIILISLGGLEGVLGVWATMFLVSNHPGDDPSQAQVMMMMMFVGRLNWKPKQVFPPIGKIWSLESVLFAFKYVLSLSVMLRCPHIGFKFNIFIVSFPK